MLILISIVLAALVIPVGVHSAHSPMHEEPEKMGQILREDVLAGANRLADAQ